MIILENMLDIWGAAMWKASWQGGLAAFSVWFVLRIVPSIPARFQCWLWRLVMVKFLVSFAWFVPIELPLLPALEQTAAMAHLQTLASELPSESVFLPEYQSFSLTQSISIPFVFWFIVVFLQIARLVLACRNARLLKKGCCQSENRQLLDVLAKSSKVACISPSPLLLESDGHGSPLLVGILRPAIVLPKFTMSQLNASELRLVISHELAHVVRRDLVCSLIAAIIRAVFFFHPLAWFSERRMGLAQEMAADELAIQLQNQEPAKYASMLISVISKLGTVEMVPTMSVGAVGSNWSLKQRLSAMRFMKPVSSRTAILYCFVLGLVSVTCLVPFSIVTATASATEQTESKETIIKGTFVSFKDGVLKISVLDNGNQVAKEYQWNVADETKTISHFRDTAQEGSARHAFQLCESGAIVAVRLIDNKVNLVELGMKKSPDRVPEKSTDKASQKAKTGWGRFVSFKAGLLTINSNADDLIETTISENAKILVWNDAENMYKPAVNAAILKEVKDGTWVVINFAKDNVTVRIGAKKVSTVGTFVSYKDGRLLMLGKDLGESYTKKYGNNLHFNKFREDVPAHESVDGSEYQLIGTANKVLGNVKEGTIITIHGEGDDNIVLVQIGVAK